MLHSSEKLFPKLFSLNHFTILEPKLYSQTLDIRENIFTRFVTQSQKIFIEYMSLSNA